MFTDIFASLYTKQELLELLRQLAEIEHEFYNTTSDITATIDRTLDYNKKPLITSYFIKNNLDIRQKKTFDTFFTEFTKAARLFPTISLSLSFMPATRTIEKISSTLDQLIPHHLLDIHVDTSILGGAIIAYKGHYKDYSLKKKVEEYFAKQN